MPWKTFYNHLTGFQALILSSWLEGVTETKKKARDDFI